MKAIKINNYLIKQTFDLIYQNSLSFGNNSLSSLIEKKLKELYIFQREIDIAVQKVISFSIIGNNKQQNELKNIMNVPHLYPVNKEIINLDKTLCETQNLLPEKSEKIQIIIDDIKRNM